MRLSLIFVSENQKQPPEVFYKKDLLKKDSNIDVNFLSILRNF